MNQKIFIFAVSKDLKPDITLGGIITYCLKIPTHYFLRSFKLTFPYPPTDHLAVRLRVHAVVNKRGAKPLNSAANDKGFASREMLPGVT